MSSYPDTGFRPVRCPEGYYVVFTPSGVKVMGPYETPWKAHWQARRANLALGVEVAA